MTKEEYENFVLRYKGCGACFPMYHTLSRFEKMWFTAIQKDVAELERKLEQAEKDLSDYQFNYPTIKELQKENTELKEKLNFSTQYYQGEKAKEQLAKAKEIITALLNVFVYDLADDEMDTGDIDTKIKAEQFLKEIE